MNASKIYPHKFAKLCKRCACLQLSSTTPDVIPPRNSSAGEQSQEQEVDLDWNVTRSLDEAFSEGRPECDCCEFLSDVVRWWEYRDTSVKKFFSKHVPVSLHYVFRFDETDGYGLKSLRIRIRPEGEELHLDCPITAATDLDVGTSLRLQPPLSHINEETLSWMKSRLESCVLHDHVNPDKTFLPARLLDVRENQLSLVLTKDFKPQDAQVQRYIALTYCWGPEPYASRQRKTTTANISQHQQLIPESSLPQVIKDAVAATRALSIPFLWVDALCILQDEVSDWDKQCAVMERIYGNAYVVVAAASSHHCEEGFIRRTHRIILPLGVHPNGTRAFGIYSPLYQADDLGFAPWLHRGWTFQERIASTRLLIFAEKNVHFKCRSFREPMGGKRHTYNNDFIMLDRATIESGGTEDIYREWATTISQIYPELHKLTRTTDFLPSIAGIAALFNSKLKDEYAAGLWKNNMHQALYWILTPALMPSYQDLLKRLRSPSPYIAPSWSWAGQGEWFFFDLYHENLSADCRPEFSSLDTSITLRGESAFGEVADGALEITSKVYIGSRRITYHKVFLGESVRLDGRYFADINPDFSTEDIFESLEPRALAAPISFLLIGSTIRRSTDESISSSRHSDISETLGGDADARPDYQPSSTSSMGAESGGGLETQMRFKREAYGLLIHPTGNSNEYYRVGTFLSSTRKDGGLSLFDNFEVRTVRLV